MQASWRTYGLDKTLQADLTWGGMLYTYSEELLKFVLNATTQTLNTPDNHGDGAWQEDYHVCVETLM